MFTDKDSEKQQRLVRQSLFCELFDGQESPKINTFVKMWANSPYPDTRLDEFINDNDPYMVFRYIEATIDPKSFLGFMTVPGNKYAEEPIKKRDGTCVPAREFVSDFVEAAKYAESVGLAVPILTQILHEQAPLNEKRPLLHIALIQAMNAAPHQNFSQSIPEFFKCTAIDTNYMNFFFAVIYFMYHKKGHKMSSFLPNMKTETQEES